MGEKEIMEILQQDIAIPDIVQQKAGEAFCQIKKENSKVVRLHSHKGKWKTVWLAAAVAALALGTTVCAAAYIHWSRGLKAEFQMTPEEKQFLEEEDYMSPITDDAEVSAENDVMAAEGVTAAGVTVTPLEMIVDNRFAWLSFKVEGYELEEGKEPCFYTASVVLDGNEDAIISYYSSFYNGQRFDGDGCMEYIIQIDGTQYEKGLVGSSAHVTFQNLGTVYKAEFFPDLEAEWEFDFELKGSDEVRKVTLSETLGDSKATVTYAEISPISLFVQYDFPMKEEEIEGVNENGERITSTDFVEAPALTGVRLKDGTYLTSLVNGGAEGYLDSQETVYTASFAISRVIDTRQVDALLFLKSSPKTEYNGEGEWIEENLYVVPVE